MDFSFSKDQNLIRKTVREFSEKELWPHVTQIDTGSVIPPKIIQRMAQLGLLGMTASPEYGGVNADPITVGIVAEELARGDISCAVPTFFLVQAAWGYILEKFGTRDLKHHVFPPVTEGTGFLGIAATEPDTGSDLAAMKTHAQKQGDQYIVSGEKMYISGTREVERVLPQGGGYLTLVKTEPAQGTRGMTLLYVPLQGIPGVTFTRLDDWGRRGISSGGFSLNNVKIPVYYRIGEENKGFYHAMQGFDYARGIISVVCCGAAMRSLEHAMEYIKQRRVFGHPVGQYEGVQLKLAEHWARLDALRLLSYKALWLYNKEMQGEELRFDVTRACAEAKLLAPASAFAAINDAIQWFGAFGYTVECPLFLALQGVRSYFWAEGAREIMGVIVARELLGREFVAYR